METRSERPVGPEALRQASLQARRARERAAAGDPESAAAQLGAAVVEFGPIGLLCVPLALLLQRAGRWEALASLCRQACSACGDAREAAGWQLRLAEACEALGDLDGAIAAYRTSLAARPHDVHALEALQRLHRRQGDWAALVRALEGELALRAGGEEIVLRLELAQILEKRLQRGADALIHLRRVLDLEPGDSETLTHANTLAMTLGATAEQVDLLEIALGLATRPAERARLLARQAALLAGPLASPAQAIPRWREALELDASVVGAQEGLHTALEQLEDWPALLDCLHQESCGKGPDARRSLLERAACVAAEHFGADAALPWLERLRAEAPGDASVVARIADLQRAARRVRVLQAATPGARERAPEGGAQPLPVRPYGDKPARSVRVPTLAAAPAAADPEAAVREAERELAGLDPAVPVFAERRRALERELAHLWADSLQDPERALPHLRVLVEATPRARDIPALEAERAWAEQRLLAHLRAEGSHLELAERLAARLDRSPDDTAGWLELATLQERELFAPAAAAQAYREVLARGGPGTQALQGLRRASEALGDFSEVARTLEAELAEQTSPGERATLLRTLGEVAWRRLGATTRASRAFAAALEADPRDLVSLRALQQLLACMEDWRGELDLIESEAELLPSEARGERRSLWLRAASIAAERVKDLERAVRALDAANALAPLDRAMRTRLAEWLRRSGARERYVEVATALCDDPDVESDASAELQLASVLHELGRLEPARARVKRALCTAPRLTGAWDLLAEIRLAQGARDEAAESLVRAAGSTAASPAVARLLRAAALVEDRDPEYAHALREHACLRDAGSATAHAARAGSALALGRLDEAEKTATRAVELARASDAGAPALVETVLAVAACAQHAGRVGLASRLLEGAVALAPEHSGALRASAEALFELGDRCGARRAALALFERDEASQKDARLLLLDAEGLEHENALDEAAERFAEVARLDPSLEAAWAGLARVHERAGRPLEAVRALDAWAQAAAPADQLACQLRAAEILLAHGRDGSAEPRLRELLRSAPGCARGVQLLATQLLDEARPEEALAVLGDAAAAADAPEAHATHARLCARALEDLGRGDDACAAHARVLEADPDAVDAARARAAWLRAQGAWRDAASGLEAFLEHAARAPASALAEVWLELAQLRAAPLGDAEGARRACGEAVRLSPGLPAALEMLADLLLEDPAQRDEAVARHRQLLEVTPERVASVRALTTLAAALGRGRVAEDGHALLQALGSGACEAPSSRRLRLRVAKAPSLENPVWECARRLACAAASEISRALGASLALAPPEPAGAVEAFRLAAVLAEAELAGPALVPLPDDKVGAVLFTVAALAAERDIVSGDGRLVNALAEQLGRGARRRLREILGDTAPEEIAEIDCHAWRSALRALAHAVALDASDGNLPVALQALAEEDGAEGSAAVTELLRRVVEAFGRAVAGEDEGEEP